jgi:hypothetical protein
MRNCAGAICGDTGHHTDNRAVLEPSNLLQQELINSHHDIQPEVQVTPEGENVLCACNASIVLHSLNLAQLVLHLVHHTAIQVRCELQQEQ